MVCLNILKFNLISKKYLYKKSDKKLKNLFKIYKTYIKKLFLKYYYLGFLSYKTINYIILI